MWIRLHQHQAADGIEGAFESPPDANREQTREALGFDGE
jgi:hypothetical protein